MLLLLLGVVVRPDVWCAHRSMCGGLVTVVVRMSCGGVRSERAQNLSFIPCFPIPGSRLSQLSCPHNSCATKRSCKHVYILRSIEAVLARHPSRALKGRNNTISGNCGMAVSAGHLGFSET